MPSGIYERTEEHRQSMCGRTAWNKGLTKNTSDILKKQGIEHSKRMLGRKGNINCINAMANKNRGTPRTEEIKMKISNSHKGMKKPWSSEYNSKRVGKLNPNWLGGITPEYAARFNKSIWKNIRKLVIQRDGNMCQKCGINKRILDVHHKKPWRFSKDDSSDNLISLCRSCHRKEDSILQSNIKLKIG